MNLYRHGQDNLEKKKKSRKNCHRSCRLRQRWGVQLQGLCWKISPVYWPCPFIEVVEAPPGCHTGHPSHYCTVLALLLAIEKETSECAPHLEPGTQVGSVVGVWGQVVIYVDGKWKSEHKKIKDLEFRQQTHDPELGCFV